jgi:cytoskeletal protein CcmA (bactofilin family)
MFGSDKNSPSANRRSAASSNKDGGVTILTSGCHFSGKLYCRGATRIGGTIDGEVVAEGLLIVEEDAVINASVKAEEIVVHGRVEGQVNVQRKIEMCATADVQADVHTPNLIVHEGALFNGRTSMARSAVTGEAGTRNGKTSTDNRMINIESGSDDSINGIAARVPEITPA